MFLKLNDKCVLFETQGVPMLGNTVTGDLFGLTEEGYHLAEKLIKGSDIEPALLLDSEAELLRALVESGLINSEKLPLVQRTAYFHVTSRCNMKCIGCYSQSNHTMHTQDLLSTEDLTKIIDNMVRAGVDTVIVSGGEPFLRNDIIDVLAYLKKIAMVKQVICITNGYANIDTYIQAMKYVDRLSFSLDGATMQTSFLRKASFSKVTSTIKHLKDAGYPVAIIFTLHKKNLEYYVQMKEFAESMKVDYNFSLFTTKASEETMDYLMGTDEIERLGEFINSGENVDDVDVQISCRECCGAGNAMISIADNGDVLPCHMFFVPEFKIGNAMMDELSKILPIEYKPLIKVDEKDDCSSCEYRYICGGGCPFRGYVINRDLRGKDPLCPVYRTNIERNLRALIG